MCVRIRVSKCVRDIEREREEDKDRFIDGPKIS